MNFDTISTKPEKSLSGKLSEILGTLSKKAKTDQQENENVPQLDGMIDIQEEKPQNKKDSVGNSRQKDSGKRTSAKIREKESSKSKEILHEKSKETLQETLKRLKKERESSKNEESIQEKSKETLQETLKRLREERDSSKSKEKQLSTKSKEREPSTSSKEKTKSTKESLSKEEKKEYVPFALQCLNASSSQTHHKITPTHITLINKSFVKGKQTHSRMHPLRLHNTKSHKSLC